jgi:hypothetical protein
MPLGFATLFMYLITAQLIVVGNLFVKKHSIISVLQITAHNDKIYRNQFRNRVYNMFHHRYSPSDWWYILDADEILTEDPRLC